MHFRDFQYTRPDLKSITSKFNELLSDFTMADSAGKQVKIIAEINTLRSEFESMKEIATIRHAIDTEDEFYKNENDYFDRSEPAYIGLLNAYYEHITASEFKSILIEKFGSQLFQLGQFAIKTYDKRIEDDLKRENQLCTEYTRLIASARIDFEGETYNLSGLNAFETSPISELRRGASKAKFGFFETHKEELDQLFDQLVKTRTDIARKLGYENFTELARYRMLRMDYDLNMVSHFREEVKRHVIPLVSKLRRRQAERLQKEQLFYFDESLIFPDGNPSPNGDAEWIVRQGKKMFEKISKETGDFFHYMDQSGLMDLINKHGKAGGGFCDFITKYKAPFIFSNFNGTLNDIDVLTHESGHAFQVFCSRDMQVPEYNFPTYEACEIHSMSMEFFTWPHMELFFENDADKYRYNHMCSNIFFMPYGVAVDEFQELVYTHPEANPAERKEMWKAMEKKYLPERNYHDNQFLLDGGFWQKQSHIYRIPFYYIDYVLALTCAFQFWQMDTKDHEKAWQSFLKICYIGGSKSFLDIINEAGLTSPFQPNCLAPLMKSIEVWLDENDPG